MPNGHGGDIERHESHSFRFGPRSPERLVADVPQKLQLPNPDYSGQCHTPSTCHAYNEDDTV